MNRTVETALAVFMILLLSGCASVGKYSSNPTRFGSRDSLGMIEHDPIREASGIVASRDNVNVLWIHNDSGEHALYAVNTRGEHLGTYLLNGCTDSDWEDITIGRVTGRDEDFIYIGAIGDNRQRRETRSICRVAEPAVDEHQDAVTREINDIEVITYRYPDGSHDAETLMADPLSDELYIVTKRIKPAGVYRLPLSTSEKTPITVERIAELPFRYIVAGDISPSGEEILIKTYTAIYYWRRRTGESLADAISRSPETAPYIWESGGEAVAWEAAALGYYTVSEENLWIPARLYYYPRLTQE